MTTPTSPEITAATLPLVESRPLGRWRIHALQAGLQRLDGGAMFGVVPKPLWERRIAPDARNRIPLGMRCLLVEHEIGPVLIDTGAGAKDGAKFRDIYGLDNLGEPGPTRLEDALARVGYRPEDVVLVINTHLHFDHAGGNTTRGEDGVVRATFPNARYVVQRGEYEWATHTNERTAASYLPDNYEPLVAAGQMELVDGEQELVAGIRLIPTPGHTPHHQSILLDGGDDQALYLGDLVPTAAHLPLPWIMGYDVEPLVTLETRRRVLAEALDLDWLVVFEHDAVVPWGHLRHDGKSYVLRAEGD